MSTAQLAQSRPSPSAPVSVPIDLSKETVSIPEAARFLDCEEELVGLLCRKGAVPSHKEGGEYRITLGALMAYRRERDRIFKAFEDSPFAALTSELMATGLYWKGDPNINTRLAK